MRWVTKSLSFTTSVVFVSRGELPVRAWPSANLCVRHLIHLYYNPLFYDEEFGGRETLNRPVLIAILRHNFFFTAEGLFSV